MSILTKKVTMTETAWEAVRNIINWAARSGSQEWVRYGGDYLHYMPRDARDAITALAEAETIAVSDTYVTVRHDGYDDVDQWRLEAEQQGCRCGVCDNS